MQELEQLYDEYVDKVYKYFYVQCLNQHIAEDLTSQTFIAFIEKNETTAIEDKKKYLYAIMRNVWMEYLREKYKEAVDSLESIADFEQHAADTVTRFETTGLKNRAIFYIDQLPDKQAIIARMRLIDGYTLREISKELDKSVSYVKTTQNRAFKSLKRMLDQPELGGLLS